MTSEIALIIKNTDKMPKDIQRKMHAEWYLYEDHSQVYATTT